MKTCKKCEYEMSPDEEGEKGNCIDCTYDLKCETELREMSEWAVRALTSFIACQSAGKPAPTFSLNYNAMVLSVFSGRNEEIKAACEKFVNETITLLTPLEAKNG